MSSIVTAPDASTLTGLFLIQIKGTNIIRIMCKLYNPHRCNFIPRVYGWQYYSELKNKWCCSFSLFKAVYMELKMVDGFVSLHEELVNHNLEVPLYYLHGQGRH
eukprot:15358548-Ditylum_brightwellii.AAC.1